VYSRRGEQADERETALDKGSLQISPILRVVPLRTYRLRKHGYRSPLTVKHHVAVQNGMDSRLKLRRHCQKEGRGRPWWRRRTACCDERSRKRYSWGLCMACRASARGMIGCGSVIAQAPKVNLAFSQLWVHSTDPKPRIPKVATRANWWFPWMVQYISRLPWSSSAKLENDFAHPDDPPDTSHPPAEKVENVVKHTTIRASLLPETVLLRRRIVDACCTLYQACSAIDTQRRTHLLLLNNGAGLLAKCVLEIATARILYSCRISKDCAVVLDFESYCRSASIITRPWQSMKISMNSIGGSHVFQGDV